MASFKAVVNMMDKTSPSNLSSTSKSQKLEEHQLGQPAAHPDDHTEVVLKDVCQEMIKITNIDPLLSANTSWESSSARMMTSCLLGKCVHLPPAKNPRSI